RFVSRAARRVRPPRTTTQTATPLGDDRADRDLRGGLRLAHPARARCARAGDAALGYGTFEPVRRSHFPDRAMAGIASGAAIHRAVHPRRLAAPDRQPAV